jgi:MinD-like ATPase involved in chromosome partitioning or flagellar assembly
MKLISRFRLYKLGFLYFIPRKIIAIADQKCGVGETTSTINIRAGVTQLGERVTIFDYKPDR